MPKHYEQAENDHDLIPWSVVVERLEQAENYWLATTRPDGRPHTTPIWGAWLDGVFYFDGIYTARWARNLSANPAAVVHLESGSDVVILEGQVVDAHPEPALAERILAAFAGKYTGPLPQPSGGIYSIRPTTIRAWSRFPHDATVWKL
jgi:hypothetical protein